MLRHRRAVLSTFDRDSDLLNMAIPPATQAGAIQLISEIPKYVTIEEHKELLTSTPADFESMPPALRCLSEDVSVSFTPAIESFPSEPPTKGNIYVIDRWVKF
jgi:nucleotide-sensitive chloride channel 1A